MDFTTSVITNFVIFFYARTCGTRLEIPAHASILFRELVILRDRYGNSWRVKASEIDGVWYLLDGWIKFISDCSLETMDVLEFTYSGPGSFDVSIMGPGGDIKEGAVYHKTNVETEKDDVDTFKKVSSDKAPKSRIRIGPFGEELFAIGGIPRPKHNYYFVTRVQHKRGNELYIPKDILMDEHLNIPRKIKLVDIDGNTYTSRKVVWKGGRTFYKGGWNRLARRNHLRDNDLCICEFGEGDNTGFLFISFIRKDIE